MPFYAVAVRSKNLRLITTNWGEVESIRSRNRFVHFRKYNTHSECEDDLNEFYGCYNPPQRAVTPPPIVVAPPTPPSSTRKRQQVSDSVTLSQEYYHQTPDGSRTGVTTTATFTRKGGRSNKLFDGVMPVFSQGAAVAAEALQKGAGGASSKLASKIIGGNNSKAQGKVKQPAKKRITAGSGGGSGRARRVGSPAVDCTGFDCDLPRKIQKVSTGRVMKSLPAPPSSRNYGASENALEAIRQRQRYECEEEYENDDEGEGLPSYDDAMGYSNGGGRILGEWDGYY